jgi:hypothetical protein
MFRPLNIKATVVKSEKGHMYYPHEYLRLDGNTGTLGPVMGFSPGDRVYIHIETAMEDINSFTSIAEPIGLDLTRSFIKILGDHL